MLGWGLNIVVGLAGLLDLGYVAFYAVGAYSFALFARWFDLGFWECLPIAGLLAATFGVLLGFPVLRLRGDYLAIVTLGFGEIIRIILLNWYDGDRRPERHVRHPAADLLRPASSTARRPRARPPSTSSSASPTRRLPPGRLPLLPDPACWRWSPTCSCCASASCRSAAPGRRLREDEIACRALGINPTNTKLTAFALGAMFGGFAGSFFATRQGFISPESFTFIESATILAIVVLGGMGSQIGVVLAAIVLVLLPEFGREFDAVPHAAVRRRDGRDHGLAAARPARAPRADHPAARQDAGRGRRHGAAMTRARRCSRSSI